MTVLTIIFLFSNVALAQSSSFTYEGRLFSSSGVPLLESVDVKFQILNSAGTCVLYEEVQTGIDLSVSKGAFSLGVGSATSDTKRSANFRGAYNPSMISVFRNGATLSGIPAAGCAAGTYVAGASDSRLLRVHVTKGSTTETLSPDLVINTVPSAQVAASLQGFLPSDFLRLDVANGISGNIGLTATGVGAGQTREFRFYELAANGAEYSAFKAPDAMSTSLTYVLPSAAPAAGDILKATVPSSGIVTLSWGADAGAGGGISNFNGSNQSSQSFTAIDIAAVVTAPAWSTNTGTGAHTLQIPMASGAGVTGGLITKTEHTSFTSKVDRAGDTMTGVLNFTGATGVSLANTSGITFTGTGTIAMGTNKITGMGDPSAAQEAATKAYVDSQNSGKIGGTLTATRIPYASGASTLTDSANFTYTTATGAMTIGGTAPSITSNDAITIAAGGTNKNVVLTPSGTGYTLLNGRVGIGTATPAVGLHVSNVGGVKFQSSQGTMNFDEAAGLRMYANSANGMLIEADQHIAFKNAGSERMRIDNAGNVGVGTSAPLDTFSLGVAPVASATRAQVNLSNTALVGGSANGTYIGANPAAFTGNFIDLQVAGASKFSVSSSGVITGVGSGITGIPGAISGLTSGRIALTTGATTIGDSVDLTYSGGQLNVIGATAKARINNVYIGNSGASTLHGANGSGGLLNLQNLVSDAFSFTSYLNTTASNVFVMNARPSGSTENLLQIQKAGTGVLTVDNSGNVGIGIASPDSKLHIYEATAGSVMAHLRNNGDGVDIRLSSSATGDAIIFSGSGDTLGFGVNGSTTPSLKIGTTGNVGIGTTSPSSMLDISGSNASGTLRVYDQTVTGATREIIREGAGQGTVKLTEWQNNAGTVVASVDKTGRFVGDGSGLTGVGGGLSGLTSGRVPFATSASAIGDDAALTWDNTGKSLTNSGGLTKLTNGTSNTIYYGPNGVAAPGTGSVGAKLLLYSFNSTGSMNLSDYGFGVEGSYVWSNSNGGFKWYSNSVLKTTLDNQGTITTSGSADLAGGYLILTNGTKNVLGFTSPTPAVPGTNSTGLRINLGRSNNNMFTNDVAIGHEASGMWLNTPTDFKFYVNSVQKAVLDSNGNFGIGTTSPGSLLDVASNDGLDGLALGKSANVVTKLRIKGSNAALASESGQNLIAEAAGAGAFYVQTNGSNRMIVNSSGLVGLGLTNPTSKLHIDGGGDNIVLNIQSSNGLSSGFQMTATGAGGRSYSINSTANGSGWPGAFEIYDETAGAPRFDISSSGDVGIGTTSPAAKLDVVGTTKLGSSGTAITAMGACSITGAQFTDSNSNFTCTGVPASTGVAVNCSPNANVDDFAAWGCRATGTVNQIECHAPTGITTGVRNWTCMWIQI